MLRPPSAPANASYVVVGLNGSLSAERTIAAGTGITVVDGGPGGNVTISASGGLTIGGSDTQIQVNGSGSLTGYSGLTCDGSSFSAAFNSTIGSSRSFLVTTGTSVYIGDNDEAGNATKFYVDDTNTRCVSSHNLIVDNSGAYLVLKAPGGDYFGISVDDGGVLSTTNLGSSLP